MSQVLNYAKVREIAIMESSDRKNVYLTKTGDNSLNSGMRDTMIVGQTNMAPGI